MITSAYIVATYLTGDQVLICKYCYYFVHSKNCYCINFFVDARGM